MSVLHVTAVETDNYYLNNLADFSDSGRVRFSAVTLGGEGSFVRELQRRGVRARALSCGRRLLYPRALLQIARVVREDRIDVVHGHLFEPSLLAAIVARARRVPLVLTRHHSDAVHRLQGRVRRSAYLSLEQFVNRTAGHIIAPSQMVRSILVDREGVPPARVSLVPYPQTPSRYDGVGDVSAVRQELGMERGPALVCVSRLHPEKGHLTLFEAFRSLLDERRDLHLYLLGTGPAQGHLERTADDLGIRGRVSFLGWREDALAVISAADIVVHPSLHEALPSVVIEALMLERPIVASDVSGVRDLLGADEFGRVVPPGDAASLGRAVTETLERLDDARHRAQAGHRRALEYMDARRVAAAHISCYDAVRLLASAERDPTRV